jgi:hypothetical protein
MTSCDVLLFAKKKNGHYYRFDVREPILCEPLNDIVTEDHPRESIWTITSQLIAAEVALQDYIISRDQKNPSWHSSGTFQGSNEILETSKNPEL